MGIRRGPNIVTDGLVFAVDAANPSSYVSGSSVWKDQTVNQNNGTLINGRQFDPGNGGSINLDGVNDYIDIGNNSIFSFGDSSNDSAFSVLSWVNMDDATRFRVFNKGVDFSNNYEYIFSTGGSDTITFNLYDSSTGARIGRRYNTALTSYQGTWIQLVGTYNGSGVSGGIKVYLNGTRVDDFTNNTGTYTAMETSTNVLEIGASTSDGRYSNGKIANAQIYNKELSSTEVAQNYNALKGRFGL